MLIELIGSYWVYQWAMIASILSVWQLQNQFGNIYQYKIDIYTQTTSTSGAQVNYPTIINQDRKG